MTSSLRDLRVYTTYPHECSYLADKEATTLFVDAPAKVDGRLYSQLSALGFRRSGSHLYRPHCSQCDACVSARIIADRFEPRRNQKRAWKHNNDIQVSRVESIANDDYFDLYRRYIETRHPDGDMYPPLKDQYQSFLSNEWGVTQYHAMSVNDEIIGVAVVDSLSDGLSAIYTFYDPEQQHRSLGTFAILWQIEQAKKLGLPYVYLGYWIKECQKMAYKIQYRPLQLYTSGRWADVL